MNAFKERWEIKNNWQLIFPFLGIIALLYTAYLFSKNIIRSFIDRQEHKILYYALVVVAVAVFYYIMLRFFLWCFKKLEGKWVTDYRWEMIAIFIAFALTGTSSVRIAKPLLEWIGFTRTVFPDGFLGGSLYWILRIIIILPIYQVLLIIFGTLVGQFKFFWEFEKKMFRRMRIIK
ncbi:DUF6787 family protein [Kordia algicida OT-1]|uniref:DUF6787 domain-containing protein n=1 Tax=Kordia algicida OT-1 TaxID=391587 RepID=A9DXP8_9FLAO|nr:DUF6787 family protein [Kordia algicida]EDP96030.1 hypothetical protein KAOT1_07673 [Kordia algicida OT-1]